jgi:hypothetical protein
MKIRTPMETNILSVPINVFDNIVKECSDAITYFKLLTAVVPTPDQFEQLSQEIQLKIFDRILYLAKFSQNSCPCQNNTLKFTYACPYKNEPHGVIYRPIHPLPETWNFYRKYIDQQHPKGESKVFQPHRTHQNYRLLYYWVTGACSYCGAHQFYWHQGDKDVEYYCPVCHNETGFIKGAWAYE